jgi:hypothetical protein
MRTTRTATSRRLLLTFVAVSTAGAACTSLPAASQAPATAGVQPTVTPAPVTTPAPTSNPAPTPFPSATPGRIIPRISISPAPGDPAAVPAPIIQAVVADAAGRTGSAIGDITVVTARGVTWPNGALGCPKPGSAYTDMVEPGYQVVVEAGATRLDYRIGAGGTPQLCENPPGPG